MRLIRRFFSHHRLPVVFMCLLCGICSTYHLNQASAVFNLQKSVLDEDQALKNAESTFSAELKSAEMVYVAMRQKASAKRLSVYREKLKSFTKAGDFDKAVACKSAIESIEASGIEGSYPRPKDVVKYDGHRYGLVKEAATWHVAKKRCEMMGGHLVTLDSKGEIEWLENFCRMNKTTCWIGAHRRRSGGRVAVARRAEGG